MNTPQNKSTLPEATDHITRTARKPRVPVPSLREATPEQAQKILDRFIQKLAGPHTEVTEELYEKTMTSLETRAPEMVELLHTLHLVAKQTRTLDESDRQVLDTARAVINEHLMHDACSDTIAESLKSAILGVMKPARNLLKGSYSIST